MFLSSDIPYDAMYVFHDSENCYIPRAAELRDTDGRLRVQAGGKVQFGAPLAVQGIVIVKEVLRNAVACRIGKEFATNVDVMTAFKKLKYYFVRPNDIVPAFSPPESTVTDFGLCTDFHYLIAPDSKDGGVDKKVRELMTSAMDEVRALSSAERARVLFVLISGDRDFSPEVYAARKLQVNVAIIHSADSPLRSAMVHLLEPGFAPCCWLDIVAAGRAAAGNPYYHGKAPDPLAHAGGHAAAVRYCGGGLYGAPAGPNGGWQPAPPAGSGVGGQRGPPAGSSVGWPPAPPAGSSIGGPTGVPAGPDAGWPPAPPTGFGIGGSKGAAAGPSAGWPPASPTGFGIGGPTGALAGPSAGWPPAPPTGFGIGGPSGAPAGPSGGWPAAQPAGSGVGAPAGPGAGWQSAPPTGFGIGGPTGAPAGPSAGWPPAPPTDFGIGGSKGAAAGPSAGWPPASPTGFGIGGPTGAPAGPSAGWPPAPPTGFGIGGPTGAAAGPSGGWQPAPSPSFGIGGPKGATAGPSGGWPAAQPAGFGINGAKGAPTVFGAGTALQYPPAGSDGQVHCSHLYVADPKAVWYAKLFSLRGLTSTVRAIHTAFLVKEPPSGTQRGAKGEFPCCELVYCRDYSEPTQSQISTAIQAVSQVLSQIVVDEPLLLPGVAAVQLKDNAQLRSFAQLERVFFHLPDLKAAMATAASTTAITKASPAPAGDPVQVNSAAELMEGAKALRAHILAVAAASGNGANKMAAVDMAGFYSTCSPARKALIKEMKISAFCEAHPGLLRFTVDACLPGKIGKGWIHAVPSEVYELLKFIQEQGEVRGGGDQRRFVTAKKMGDFYGPKGAHPELKAVIRSGGRTLTEFLQLHGAYFEHRSSAREEDGYGLIIAQVPLAPVATLPPSIKAQPALPALAAVSEPASASAKVVLVYSAENTLGRDRVTQMLMSLCPPVTETIVITAPASIGMVVTALPMLRSLALRHGVLNLTLNRAPKNCTVTLSGANKCVADAKAALQTCLASLQTTSITIPKEYASKQGLFMGLRTTARALLSAGMDEGGEEDDAASAVSDGSCAAPSASGRSMYAHITNGKFISATLAFLPPPSATAEQADELLQSYTKACSALQEVASTYEEIFCKRSKILASADQHNLPRRFSLYDATSGTAGILLCGSQVAVQEAADALTVLPEQDRIERRVYNAANRSVAFLLKNKLHSGVLQSLRDAVSSAGAKVTPYTGPQSANNTALFTIEGKKSNVSAAFRGANAVEASWVESLVERALCAGRITRAQVKYIREENRPLLTSLSSQHGVFLKQTTSAAAARHGGANPTATSPSLAPALRRLLKAHMGLVEIHVLHGNMLTVGCDAIVNPANEQLSHGGGLAKVIADTAGRAEIEHEGAQLKRLLPGGQVALGTAVCTGAYQLVTLNKHAKLVIHAVGPRYSSGTATERANYRRCVLSALDLAATTPRAQVEYISLTLMGVGIYGWPAALAADLLVESIAEWVHGASERGQLKLKRIVLVDITESSAAAMALAVQNFNDRLAGLLDAMQQVVIGAPVIAQKQERPLRQWYWETQVADGAAFKAAVVKEGGRRWVPYDYDQVMLVEDALRLKTLPVLLRGDIAKVSNGAIYRIAREDFTTFDGAEAVQFTQMRTEGGIQKNFKRAVRYEPFLAGMTMAGYSELPVAPISKPAGGVSAPDAAPAVRRGLQNVSRIDTGKGDAAAASGGFSLLGKPDDIERMEAALLTALEQAKTFSASAIDLRITEPEDWEVVLTKLRADLLEAGVDAEVLPAPRSGARHVVLRACGANELTRGELEVSKFSNKVTKKLAEDSMVQWPPTWTDGPFNVQDSKVQLIEVERHSAEWNEVEFEWRNQSVAPNVVRNGTHNQLGAAYTLQSVKRIQNPVAWAAYHSRVRFTASMISSADSAASVFQRANEWLMKHGTCNTNPEQVVSSAAGIDSRYAGENLYFGKAAYTAEDAEYSHAYAYRVSSSSDGDVRQMLLVRVAAGRIHEVQEDGCRTGPHNNLKTPPDGCHSVRGNVGQNGARRMAIMVYQPDSAYPSYLLTYKLV